MGRLTHPDVRISSEEHRLSNSLKKAGVKNVAGAFPRTRDLQEQ
jgi:hypothetical protein